MKNGTNGSLFPRLRKLWSPILALALLSIPIVGMWELLRPDRPVAIRVSRLLVIFIALFSLAIISLVAKYFTTRTLLAEAHLRSQRLQMVMASGRLVGWEWDVTTGRDHWYGDLRTMFGIPSDQWSGQVDEFFRYVHPDDRERVSRAVTDAQVNHKQYEAEFRVVRQDGAVRWVSATGSFYYSKTGKPERMLGMSVDITERKHAEQALRESEERFRLVTNTAPVMIWLSGPDKLCTYFNQQWLEFTGRPLEAELGNGWSEGVHPDDLKGCLETYKQAFDKREPFDMRYRLRRHDGQYRGLQDKGVPRFEPDGSFAGYIGSCNDITDHELATDLLGSLGRRLIEAHEQERTWIARELHDDINQRLALLAIELEKWKQQVPESIDVRAHIEHARKRIFDVSKDVQSLSHRLHSSKLEYLGIATAAKSFCRELSDQHKVRIEFTHSDVPHNLPSEVSLALFRVLQEALQNGVKHSHAQDFKVELRGTPDEIHLTVRDPGAGFNQREALGSRGLGLVSMRERLQLVNGTMVIESEPGRGTTILARVPIKTDVDSTEPRRMTG